LFEDRMTLSRSLALLLLVAATAVSATDPIASIKSAVEGCRARQAAQAARVGPVKDGAGFFEPSAARTGSDAGASCVQAIEAL
jgi:hypothetical protein